MSFVTISLDWYLNIVGLKSNNKYLAYVPHQRKYEWEQEKVKVDRVGRVIEGGGIVLMGRIGSGM